MAMTPEQRRERDRLRKRDQRAKSRGSQATSATPSNSRETPAATEDTGGTGGTSADASADNLPTNLQAARELIAELTIETAAAKYRVALILQLARDLDAPSAIPQRSSLAAKYTENVDALLAIAKPREADPLDQLRRAFYTGTVGEIDDDPEARARPAPRRKATDGSAKPKRAPRPRA